LRSTMANMGKCRNCNKTVYQLEGVTAIDKVFHKGCLKCDTCGWQLTLTSYKSWENGVYCKNHFPVTGFGEKHATGTEDLGGKQFVSPRDAPKLDVQTSNVVSPRGVAAGTTSLDDVTMKTAANAPKLDTSNKSRQQFINK